MTSSMRKASGRVKNTGYTVAKLDTNIICANIQPLWMLITVLRAKSNIILTLLGEVQTAIEGILVDICYIGFADIALLKVAYCCLGFSSLKIKIGLSTMCHVDSIPI